MFCMNNAYFYFSNKITFVICWFHLDKKNWYDILEDDEKKVIFIIPLRLLGNIQFFLSMIPNQKNCLLFPMYSPIIVQIHM